MNDIIGLLAVAVLVFVNGFFVAAEFALVGARQTRIAQLASEGSGGAKAALDALNHLDSYIAATQLGITLASLGLGWVGEPAVSHLLEPLLHAILPGEVGETLSHTISVAVGFSIVTMLHIIFGELAPKSMALQRPEDISVLVARPTRLFLFVFRPVIMVLNAIGNAVVRLMGFEPASGHAQVHSPEELEMLVRSSREAGLLQESEERLLRRAFDFADLHAYEIMQPRTSVDAFDVNMPLPDLLKSVHTQHHSRYPIYEDTIDRVIGVLHTKDLFDAILARPTLLTDASGFALRSILRAPLFIPETTTVDKMLDKMQAARMHFAIVIDEYGGMAGVATMEDVLEELVGEVRDEFDVDESQGIQRKGDDMLLEGLVTLADLEDRFGDVDEEIESATIGGYIAEKLDRIPVAGDSVTYGAYRVTVESMDGMRVAWVRFKREAKTPETAEETDTAHS